MSSSSRCLMFDLEEILEALLQLRLPQSMSASWQYTLPRSGTCEHALSRACSELVADWESGYGSQPTFSWELRDGTPAGMACSCT